MKRRDERSALAAGREIRTSEVRHHIDPRELREERGVIQLDRKVLIGTVADRLPVRPHRADFFPRDAA